MQPRTEQALFSLLTIVLTSGCGSIQGGEILDGYSAATDPTQFDQLLISGDLHLDGRLVLSLLDGFAPQLGDEFQIFQVAGSIAGQFADFTLPSLHGLHWDTSDLPATGTLRVVPEPTTLFILTLGLTAIANRRSHQPRRYGPANTSIRCPV